MRNNSDGATKDKGRAVYTCNKPWTRDDGVVVFFKKKHNSKLWRQQNLTKVGLLVTCAHTINHMYVHTCMNVLFSK
jgi:hypothetical protein